MVTSLHLMLVSALQHTHTALLHLSPLPTIHSYQSRVVAGGRLSKSVTLTESDVLMQQRHSLLKVIFEYNSILQNILKHFVIMFHSNNHALDLCKSSVFSDLNVDLIQ